MTVNGHGRSGARPLGAWASRMVCRRWEIESPARSQAGVWRRGAQAASGNFCFGGRVARQRSPAAGV
jgi:hypothetical protein